MNSTSDSVLREILTDGVVRLSARDCAFTYNRLGPGILLIEIQGDDIGQFGSATVDEVAHEFERFGRKLSLFFDLRQTTGPATKVMELWTAWLAAHRHELHRVAALVPPESKLLHLTVSIAQHLSGAAGLFSIFGEPAAFEAAIREVLPTQGSVDD